MKYTSILPIGISLLIILCQFVEANHDQDKKDVTNQKKKILPKDPLFMTDLDVENLYDQWEEADDEKLPNDELEPHKRKSPLLTPKGQEEDLFNDPEKLMRASKKGKTVMSFVTVDGNPTREETERLTQRWQVGLMNAHMKCERFVVADNRALFVFNDGALAFEAVDFFLDQPELKEYSIDNRSWYGRAYLARSEECPYDPKNPSGPSKDGKCSKTS